MANPELFKAIADSTRRDIFHTLMMSNKGMTINEITDQYAMSRQAVTKHIKILTNVGLINIIPKGRERNCYADPKPLKEVYDWVSYYEKFWDNKMHLLESYLNEKAGKK